MKSVIVGTAGHIDHGKSALVRALTGTDPDRLEEEKRRGITIDLGFAHLEIAVDSLGPPAADHLRLGFVDVPGHERFVRNMLAGAGGVDVVLLVVAADEGVKPQTREHFDIVRLLHIPRGIAVLTKSDLVDAESLEVARLELKEFLRGSFMENAPIVAASSKTGAGLDELKRELANVAAESPEKSSDALLRLPVDRVFVMKGFGTVATGTLVAGSVRKDVEVEILPAGKRARVRGVQVHGRAADQATAGQRTALNLAGVSTEDLSRGDTVADVGVLQPTTRADVTVALLRSAKALKDHARVHFHCYTSEVVAEVSLVADARVAHDPSKNAPLQKLDPGGEALARLRFQSPVVLLPGDHFIIRQFSPVVTIGGGVVVDAQPERTKVSRQLRLTKLLALARGTPGQQLGARVSRAGTGGLTMNRAVSETGLSRHAIEQLLPEYTGSISRYGDVLVSNPVLASLEVCCVEWLTEFHRANPLSQGMSREELRAKTGAAPEVFGALLARLADCGKIEVTREFVRLAGRGVAMKNEEAESHRQIEQAFVSAGLKVPALKDVLAGVKVDRTRAQKIVTLLLRDRVLVKLADDLVFHRDALAALRAVIAAQKSKSPKIDVAKFKELTGVSRKYAIPLLEWLDRERVTRRVGDERIIL